MRSQIISLSLLLGSPAALADATPVEPAPTPVASKVTPRVVSAQQATPTSNLPPIDLTEMPEQCRTIAKQAGAVNLQTALAARISLASCLADVKTAKLALLDCEDSVLALDEATKPSFELLDGVIAATTDDVQKIVAEQAKAELYNNMTTRMLATLPAPGTTESAIAMHTARKQILDGLLGRWRDAAAGSYEHILAIVKASPRLEKNPVVATAMRTAKDRLRLHVASAQPAPEPPPASDDKPKTEAGEQLR